MNLSHRIGSVVSIDGDVRKSMGRDPLATRLAVALAWSRHVALVCSECREPQVVPAKAKGRKCKTTPRCPGTLHSPLDVAEGRDLGICSRAGCGLPAALETIRPASPICRRCAPLLENP